MGELNDRMVSFNPPSVEDFCHLRNLVGWGEIGYVLAQESLLNSLFHACIYSKHKLLAMGRVLGDGYMYFYIQDLIVHPDFQGQGLGKVVIEHIETYLSRAAQKGSTVGLFAANGMENFYTPYGYKKRTGEPLGQGMCKFI
jgi:GNAT superfamily N-acetyltransferase